jgi:hypothetical protein
MGGRNMETGIQEYSPTTAALAKLKAELAGKKYDVSTTAGMNVAKVDRRELVSLRTSLESKRKEIKAPALAHCKLIDDEAKRITAELVALEQPIDILIKEEEARKEEIRLEKERQAAAAQKILDDKIIEIGKLPLRCIGQDSHEITVFMAALEAREIGGEFVGDTRTRAELAKSEAVAEIRVYLAQVKENEEKAAILKAEQEAEAARLEAERVEREAAEKIRLAEVAKQQAELAEQKRLNDLEAARLKKQADEEAAKLQAERDAFAAEQKAAADKQAAIEAEAKKKQDAIDAENKRIHDELLEKQREEEKQAAIAAQVAEEVAKIEREIVAKVQQTSETDYSSSEVMVTIPKSEYDELLHDSKKLNALESAGVDNWEGYDFAMEAMEEEAML